MKKDKMSATVVAALIAATLLVPVSALATSTRQSAHADQLQNENITQTTSSTQDAQSLFSSTVD